jgi:hypothetical protein
MQTQKFKTGVLGFMALGLTVGALAILGCESDDDENVRRATLRGTEEVPPVTTNASGSAELTISDDLTQVAYTLSYTGLANVTQAHIHVGAVGVNGPIILFLCTNLALPAGVPAPPACPAAAGTVTGTLTAANLIPNAAAGINTFADAITAILNGNTYTNVHTQAFPGGEVRGQNFP